MDTTAQEQARPVTAGFLTRYFWWIVGAVAVVCALITVRAGRSAGFMDDDLANLGYGKRYGFGTESFLGLAENRDHILPATAVVNKALSGAGPYWWMAQGITAVLVAVVVLAAAAMVIRLAGSAPVALAVAFAVGASAVIGRIALWWTASALQLPMLAAALLTLMLAVMWWRSRAWGLLVACVVAQLVAQAFSDRAVLVTLLVVLVLALLPPGDGPSMSAPVARVRSVLPLVVPLFALAAIQVGATVLLASANTTPGFEAVSGLSASGWLDVLVNWWGRGVAGVLTNYFPPPVSILVEGTALTGTRTLAVLAAGAMVLVLLLALTVRNRAAAVAWAGAGLLVTLSGAQIAAGRVGTLGAAGIALIPRYQEITLLVLVTVIPLAWTLSGRPVPRLRTSLVAGIALVAAFAWLVQLRASVRRALDRPIAAATYARNLSSSLDALGAGGRPFTVLDDRVPEYVMGRYPQTASFSWLSSAVLVLAAGAQPPAFDSRAGEIVAVNEQGLALPVKGVSRSSVPRSRLGCRSAPQNSDWLKDSVRIDVPVSGKATASGRPLLLDVTLRRSGSAGTVGVTPDTSFVPLRAFMLSRDPNGFRVLLPPGTASVALDLWGGASTCFTRVSTAVLVPREP